MDHDERQSSDEEMLDLFERMMRLQNPSPQAPPALPENPLTAPAPAASEPPDEPAVDEVASVAEEDIFRLPDIPEGFTLRATVGDLLETPPPTLPEKSLPTEPAPPEKPLTAPAPAATEPPEENPVAEVSSVADEEIFHLPDIPENFAPRATDDDLLEALPSLPTAPDELQPLPRDPSLAERAMEGLRLEDSPSDVTWPEEALRLPDFDAAHLQAFPSPQMKAPEAAEAEPLVIREIRRDDDLESVLRSSRFPRLLRLAETWQEIWNGPLGWSAHPENHFLVARKVFLRLLLGAGLPIVLTVLLTLPFAGYAFPARALEASRSTLGWGRGVAEFPPVVEYVQLDEGGQLPSSTIALLTRLYGSYWSAFDAAVQSGDPSGLSAILGPEALASAQADVRSLHDGGLTRQAFGAFAAADLLLRSGTPAQVPTEVLASIPSPLELTLNDRDGQMVAQRFYGGLSVTFALDNLGAWHISALIFEPMGG